MSKIMIGVFLGVFVSALIYEVIYRQNPEMMDAIKRKFDEKVLDVLTPDEA